jgi:catechol 2,3-dioxygenase-like lactoylglutathione lyase family enzyme
MLIGYTLVGTNDMQRALAFYDALFATMGGSRLIELPTLAGWGTSWDKPIFGIGIPHDGGPASPGNGNMVALGLRTRAKVRAAHAKALELGGTEASAPNLQGPETSQAFYAAYVRDLDGNKLCFYCVGQDGGA